MRDEAAAEAAAAEAAAAEAEAAEAAPRRKRERDSEGDKGRQATEAASTDVGGSETGIGDGSDASATEATFEIACPIGPVPHCSWGGSVHGAGPGDKI